MPKKPHKFVTCGECLHNEICVMVWTLADGLGVEKGTKVYRRGGFKANSEPHCGHFLSRARYEKSICPVTDNPEEDAFYERLEKGSPDTGARRMRK